MERICLRKRITKLGKEGNVDALVKEVRQDAKTTEPHRNSSSFTSRVQLVGWFVLHYAVFHFCGLFDSVSFLPSECQNIV